MGQNRKTFTDHHLWNLAEKAHLLWNHFSVIIGLHLRENEYFIVNQKLIILIVVKGKG